jgi:peptidoglycan/xylan/chitin deacetylase (PgdA/CDA1 family)
MRVPILVYHQITPQPPPGLRKYAVTPAVFRQQMAWLGLLGYVPITLNALLAARQGGLPLPRRPVVLTFDDGFQECADFALPLLQARGWPAIFYVVAGCAGLPAQWLLERHGSTWAVMDWVTTQRVQAAGAQCGAHSLSHPRLIDLDPDDCRFQLREGRRRLEEALGRPVDHLAYPYGAYNDRIPINGQDSLLDFIVRLRTSQTWREALHASRLGHHPRSQWPVSGQGR